MMAAHQDLLKRLNRMEQRYDRRFKIVYSASCFYFGVAMLNGASHGQWSNYIDKIFTLVFFMLPHAVQAI